MSNQTLELNFQKAVKKKEATIIKLQVNQHAHTSMPGDYWIQTKDLEIIVECKEINCYKKRSSLPRFDIKRFTQEYKMKLWQNSWSRNKGFLFVVFWYGRIKSSRSFLIPLDVWLERKKSFTKRCLMEDDMYEIFKDCLDNDWTLNWRKLKC